MKVLIDVLHPAHYLFYSRIIERLKQQGNEVLITAREKDVTLNLLEKAGVEYVSLSSSGKGLFGLGRELAVRLGRLIRICREFRPDVMLAKNSGVCIGPAGALLRIPTIVMEDTEHARLQRMIGLGFVRCIITGSGYKGSHGHRQKQFKGVWPMSYLGPGLFEGDKKILEKYGVDVQSGYIVLRTVSWQAAHDAGHKAAGAEELLEIIKRLSRFARVILCSEAGVPNELAEYVSKVPAEYIHHLLQFAKLYIGQGGSMAAEAAVLGVPSVFCSPLRCGYLQWLEKTYGLVYNADTLAEGLELAENILQKKAAGSEWKRKRQRLIDDSDDIIEFFLATIAQYVGEKKS